MPPKKKDPLVEAPVVEAATVPVIPAPPKKEPAFVEDAGARLAFDRSGPVINTGLTEGRDSIAAVTAHAKSILSE